jgi:hypothetical protein
MKSRISSYVLDETCIVEQQWEVYSVNMRYRTFVQALILLSPVM